MDIALTATRCPACGHHKRNSNLLVKEESEAWESWHELAMRLDRLMGRLHQLESGSPVQALPGVVPGAAVLRGPRGRRESA